MDGLSALPWTARWCQGTLPCPCPLVPNPSIRGVGAPMDGLSALPWTARWCQGTLPCLVLLLLVPLSTFHPFQCTCGNLGAAKMVKVVENGERGSHSNCGGNSKTQRNIGDHS